MKGFISQSATILLFTFLFVATVSSIVGISLLYLRPQFVVNQIEKYLVPPPEIEQRELRGIGIMGDSQSDEYRADDNRGSNYPNSTFNWVEILAQERGVDFGEWSYFEEPRRQGFAYNYARSGATAATMIEQGQHTQLAKDVAAGRVNIVIIYIGANDFAPYLYDNAYSAIYNGEMTRAEILGKENQIVAHIKTAVETVQEAGDSQIFIATIPDWGNNTIVKVGFPFPHRRYAVTEAINETNTKIREMAERHDAVIIDSNQFFQTLRSGDDSYTVQIGDMVLEQFLTQNNPRNVFLEDRVHLGTAVNGLFANYVLEHINPYLVDPISPLSDTEILEIAGLI